MDLDKDYYKILQIDQNASEIQIKRAYRKMALKWHPDRVNILEKDYAETIFKEIGDAYYVLGNRQRRREYDLHRSVVSSPDKQHNPKPDLNERWKDQYYEEFLKKHQSKSFVYRFYASQLFENKDKLFAKIIAIIYLIMAYLHSIDAFICMLIFIPIPMVCIYFGASFSNFIFGWILLLFPGLIYIYDHLKSIF